MTPMIKLLLPAVPGTGVPVIKPVLATRISPVGSEPLTIVHVKGAVPPVTPSVAV